MDVSTVGSPRIEVTQNHVERAPCFLLGLAKTFCRAEWEQIMELVKSLDSSCTVKVESGFYRLLFLSSQMIKTHRGTNGISS
jgi:hypothetical protein